MAKMVARFWADDDGLTSVEYAQLLVLIVLVALSAWTAFGGNVTTRLKNVVAAIG